MNKLLCAFGIHFYGKWVEYQKIRIVSGKNQEYLQGFRYFYSATCPHCNKIKHRSVTVK